MNKKKVIIALILLILIIVSLILIIKHTKKEIAQTEVAESQEDITMEQEDIQLVEGQEDENTSHEIEQQEETTKLEIVENKIIEKNTNVSSPEGVSEYLVNNDKAIDYIIEYAAMFNAQEIIGCNKNEIKIYMAIESIVNNSQNTLIEIPTAIVKLAYKELFGEEIDIFTNAYFYKYDNNKEVYIKDGNQDLKKASIVKITKIEEKEGTKEIEYYYTFDENGKNVENNTCYKTTIKIKNNNEFSFSKYRMVDVDSIIGQPVGKVSDNK